MNTTGEEMSTKCWCGRWLWLRWDSRKVCPIHSTMHKPGDAAYFRELEREKLPPTQREKP